MVVRPSPPNGQVKPGTPLPSEEYSPFETPEPVRNTRSPEVNTY
jgi:hypothetical protein